jgi:hypothetical protein
MASAAGAPAGAVSTTAPATTTAVTGAAGGQAGYADQTSFQAAAFKLGEIDAAHQACDGQRKDYRQRYDGLVAQAHPGFRDQALAIYDQQYKTYTDMLGAGLASTCSPAQSAQLDQTAALYFKMLEPGVTVPPPPTVAAQNPPSQATTAAVATTSAATTAPAASTTSTTASVGAPFTPSTVDTTPYGPPRALAQARFDECTAIEEDLFNRTGARTPVEAHQQLASSTANRDANRCQPACLEAVQTINRADRTHPGYRVKNPLTQDDVDQAISQCNSKYDTAMASYRNETGSASPPPAATKAVATGDYSELWSDTEILLARERADECDAMQREILENPSRYPGQKANPAKQSVRSCKTSCTSAWSSMATAKHKYGQGGSDRTIEVHVPACRENHELALASYAELQGVAAERDAMVAATASGDAAGNVQRFFDQHSPWVIQISSGDLSGSFSDQYTAYTKFNITDIESVALVHHPKVGYFFKFTCIDRSSCVQLGDDRGGNVEFRGVSSANVSVNGSAGSANDMERINAFGLDLERWAVSMGGKVNANFGN